MAVPYAVGLVLDHYPRFTPAQVRARLRYSTFVDPKRRYLYFEVPKAACTSMKYLLRHLQGDPPLRTAFVSGMPLTRRDMFIHVRENVRLPSLTDLPDTAQKEVLTAPDFLRMTIVRNPYARIGSAWANKVALCEPSFEIAGAGGNPIDPNGPSFADFVAFLRTEQLDVANPHWSWQTTHIFARAFDFNLVGKVEALSECLERFARHLGLEAVPVLPARNETTFVRAAYDPGLAETVYELYRPDFELFGYARDSWPSAAAPALDPLVAKALAEVIERNRVIGDLYAALDRARARLEVAERLGLAAITDRLAALYRGARALRRNRAPLA